MKKTALLSVVVLAGIPALIGLSLNAVTAQTPGKILLKKELLPKSLSAAMADRLITKSLEAGKKEAVVEQIAMDSQMKKILAEIQPERMALKKVLDASPFYKGYMASWEGILRRADMTPMQKHLALMELEKKNRPSYEMALKKSGINLVAMQAKIARIAPDAKFEGATLVRLGRRRVFPSLGQGPNITETVLSKPFAVQVDDMFSHGISMKNADADANAISGQCEADAGVMGGVGSGEATAAVGHFIQVPAGVKRIEVVATVNREFALSAFSVAAVSSAGATGFLEIDGLDGTRVVAKEDFGMVSAPLFWSAHRDGHQQPVAMIASANVPPQGGQYQVRARVTSSVGTTGLGGSATANTEGICEKIVVRMIR